MFGQCSGPCLRGRYVSSNSKRLIQNRKHWKRTVDRSLTTQLFQHLGGTSKSVTRLSDGDIEDELLNTEFPHGVSGLFSRFSHFDFAQGLA
jgi:hypothetical protein